MTVKLTNTIIGLILILISISTIVPLTIQVIKSGGGGFGFGALLLPAILPLSICTVFGLFGMIDYQKNYRRIKNLFIVGHVLTAIIGIGIFLLIPIYPFLFIAIPVAWVLVTTMTRENVGRQILLNNGLILTCMGILITLLITSSEKSFLERIVDLWK